jgi:hypothetical protein
VGFCVLANWRIGELENWGIRELENLRIGYWLLVIWEEGGMADSRMKLPASTLPSQQMTNP